MTASRFAHGAVLAGVLFVGVPLYALGFAVAFTMAFTVHLTRELLGPVADWVGGSHE